jgi:hypothetical protein
MGITVQTCAGYTEMAKEGKLSTTFLLTGNIHKYTYICSLDPGISSFACIILNFYRESGPSQNSKIIKAV